MKTQAKPTISGTKLPQDGGRLHDQFGRIFDYLRIAVNEWCNLRCVYCMPEDGIDFLPNRRLLSSDEIVRIIRIAPRLGIRKVRFTGGEPLLRGDIVELIAEAVRMPGIESVNLTTNGLLLARKAEALRETGLHGINISLDTLDHVKFTKITRHQGLEEVLKNLRLVLDLSFSSVKLNMVVMRDFNHGEIGRFAELTRGDRLTVRFIELMPFDAHQIWRTGKFFGAERIVAELKRLYPHLETVEGAGTEYHLFHVPGYRGKLAVVPAFTRSLCSECSRVRVTADGKIRNCLYSDDEFNLRDLMRRGGTDDEISHIFRSAIWAKPRDGWEAKDRGNHHRESMTQIGG